MTSRDGPGPAGAPAPQRRWPSRPAPATSAETVAGGPSMTRGPDASVRQGAQSPSRPTPAEFLQSVIILITTPRPCGKAIPAPGASPKRRGRVQHRPSRKPRRAALSIRASPRKHLGDNPGASPTTNLAGKEGPRAAMSPQARHPAWHRSLLRQKPAPATRRRDSPQNRRRIPRGRRRAVPSAARQPP